MGTYASEVEVALGGVALGTLVEGLETVGTGYTLATRFDYPFICDNPVALWEIWWS
mgnify:CR=1 FL=1